MKGVNIRLVVTGVFLLPFACIHSSGNTGLPNVKSAALLLDQTPTQIGEYTIRLPKGYSEVAPPPEIISQRQHGYNNHLYSGDRRIDGTAASLGLSIATPPPGIMGKLSLDEALEGTLRQKKRQWRNFTEGPKQLSQINGLTFKWVRFGGLVSGNIGTRRAIGLDYVAIDGRNIINIQAEDVEVFNKQSIPLFEMAVSTFHRRASK